MTNVILIKTTCDKPEVLEAIANAMVEKKLGACCQISGPNSSIYRWENKVETAQEWILEIKTVDRKLGAVTEAIERLHTYDEPEIIAVEVVGGSKSYLKWIGSQVS